MTARASAFASRSTMERILAAPSAPRTPPSGPVMVKTSVTIDSPGSFCDRISGMPVFHLRPADPSLFTADRFPVFGADISKTGFYGFPLHPRAGVVKIA